MQTECIDNQLYFSTTIPIIENTPFTLYEMFPFPQTSPGHPTIFHFIKPSHKYLIITDAVTRYTFLDSLNRCLEITERYHLCYLPTSYLNIDESCEMLTFRQLATGTRYCNISSIYSVLDVAHHITKNQWLLIHSQETPITINCNHSKSISYHHLPLASDFT